MLNVIVINKGERKCIIFDVAVPDHIGVSDKEKQKVAKYQDLKREIKKIRNIRIVIVVPLIAVALGSITKKLDEWLGSFNYYVLTIIAIYLLLEMQR